MLRKFFSNMATQLPSQCAVCRSWCSQRVCSACSALLARPAARCSGCARLLNTGQAGRTGAKCGACISAPLGLGYCLAAVDYSYPWDEMVALLKFARGDPAIARQVADVMAQQAQIVHALSRADLVIPIPLSSQRLRERGFNQSLEIARALAVSPAWQAHGGRPALQIEPLWLLRLRDTTPQMGLSSAQRRANVRGVFTVEPKHAGQIRGKHIVLLDDVSTTGATLSAAAQALTLAGAAEINAVVFAKTVSEA